MSSLEEDIIAFSKGLVRDCALIADEGKETLLLHPDFAAVAEHQVVNLQNTFEAQVLDRFNVARLPMKCIKRMEILPRPLPRRPDGSLDQDRLSECRRPPVSNGSSTAQQPECYAAIEEYLRGIASIGSFPPDANLELDLGLDSLAKTELLTFLEERFGREHVDAAMLAQCQTPLALATAIAHGRAYAHHAIQLPWEKTIFPALLYLTAKPLLKCMAKIAMAGQENIPSGPCIFAPNHQSLLDAFLFSIGMKLNTYRQTYYYATTKHVGKGIGKLFARLHHVVPMDIHGDLRDSLAYMAGKLRQGKNVAVFPEGKRTIDGELGTFRKGVAWLARETGAPIVPVVIDGARRMLPRTACFPHLGTDIAITFLPPFHHGQENTLEETTQRLKEMIQRQLDSKASRSKAPERSIHP